MTEPVGTKPFRTPRRPKIVVGLPVQDPLAAGQAEARLRDVFPDHDIVILGGAAGMMEVRG